MLEKKTASIRLAAMNLLARREHSRKEIVRKLAPSLESVAVLNEVLDRLEQDNLLCDERFARSFVRLGIAKGHGPVRIAQGLRQKGINEELQELALEGADADWYALTEAARRKKFGKRLPETLKGKSQQIKFLQYRGFPISVIMALF